MTSALHYEDLDTNRVDAIFGDNGELLVSLSPNHASALISFIETIWVTNSWGKNRTPYHARLVPLAKGLLVILRILFKHSKLFDFGGVIILKSTSQTWEQLPDGQVLFRIMR
jgi:hypothetical protein